MSTRTSSQTAIAIGSEFQINIYTADYQNEQVVTALVGGGFVVSWESFGQDGDIHGVFAQVFDASGTAIGDEIAVNDTTAGAQYAPRVIALEGGGFAISWVDYSLSTQIPTRSNIQRCMSGCLPPMVQPLPVNSV